MEKKKQTEMGDKVCQKKKKTKWVVKESLFFGSNNKKIKESL